MTTDITENEKKEINQPAQEIKQTYPPVTLEFINASYKDLFKSYPPTKSTLIPLEVRTATPETVDEIIDYLLKKKSLENNSINRTTVRATMAALAQMGATVKSTGTNVFF